MASLDRVPLVGSRGERAGRLSRLPAASSPGRATSRCSIRIRARGSPLWKPLLAAALLLGAHAARAARLAAARLPRRGLALVPRHAGADDRTGAGGLAGARRSLHVPAARRARDRARLGRGRRWWARAGAGARRSRAPRCWSSRCSRARRARSSATGTTASSLFEHALEVTEDNHIAHALLGAAYAERGRLAETIRHYREAVRIRPDFRTAANNLAWLLATARDPALRDPALRGEPRGARRGARRPRRIRRCSTRSRPPTPRRVASTTRCASRSSARCGRRRRRDRPRSPSRCARGSRSTASGRRVSGMTNGDQVHGGAAAQRRSRPASPARPSGVPTRNESHSQARIAASNGGALCGARRCSSV